MRNSYNMQNKTDFSISYKLLGMEFKVPQQLKMNYI